MKYVLVTLGLMLAGVPLAGAAPVTFIYTSTTNTSAAGGSAAEPVTVDFTFDSTLANGTGDFALDGQNGSYGPWSGTLTMGNQTVALTGGDINVTNNVTLHFAGGATQTLDGYSFRWDGPNPNFPGVTSSGTLFGQKLTFFLIDIVDNSATMLSSTALPTNTSFVPTTDYYIQDEYNLANGTSLGTTEFSPQGKPFTLTSSGGPPPPPIVAQFWDGHGAANDGKVAGGAGTWNATTTNWTDAGGTANRKWQGGVAAFSGNPGTVTLGGPISVTGLLFEPNGYVISGASVLTLAGPAPTITGGATIATPLAGKNGLIENGDGKLTLTNAGNSYTGGTTVAGALQIGTASAVGSIGAGAIAIDTGAALTLVNATGNHLTNNVSNGAGGLATLVVDSTKTNTLSGALSDGAGQLLLTQNGVGTTILANAANTYSGATTVFHGVLQVGTAAAAGSIGAGSAVTIANGGTLKLVNLGGNELATEPAAGPFDEVKNVSANDFTNNIQVGVGGTLILNPVSNLVLSGAVSGFGALNVVGVNPIDGMPMPTSAFAPVSVILTGTNGYTGTVTVSSGILQIGDGVSGSLAPGGPVTVNHYATLTLDLAESGILANSITNNGLISLIGANDTNILGTIAGAGSVTKSGPGSVTLLNGNTYTGGTTISGGTLAADNSFGSATGKGPVTVGSGATLAGGGAITGAVTLSKGGEVFPGAGGFSETGSSTLHLATMTWDGGGTLGFGVDADTSDEIVLSGALTKAGAGTWNIQLEDVGLAHTGLVSSKIYTLLTFSSTNLTLANFNLELPLFVGGTLVETKTSLLLEDVVAMPFPLSGSGPAEEPAEGGEISLVAGGAEAPAGGLGSSSELSSLTPAPEPGSALLLVLGGSVFLGRRRR